MRISIKTLLFSLSAALIFIFLAQSCTYSVNSRWSDGIEAENIFPMLTIYVTPPITNQYILPSDAISKEFIADMISLKGTPGEFKPATFTVKTSDNISGLNISTSDLLGPSGIISSSAVDIRVVKCWYQDKGSDEGDPGYSGQKILIPELLLKDSRLVKVEDRENYLKLTDGTYRWISDPTKGMDYTTPASADFAVQDSDQLQPLDLISGQNQQFWILIKIPATASTGMYTGNLSLKNSTGELAQIQLQVDVLPFTLSSSMLEYDLYYFGESSPKYPEGSISHQYKSDQQMTAEFRNMADHGIYNVSLGNYEHDIRDWNNLGKVLTIKNVSGMQGRDLFYNWLGNDNYGGGLDWQTAEPTELEKIKQATLDVINFARKYGVTDIYAYGLDEVYGESDILKFGHSFRTFREAGAKIYIAGSESRGNYLSLLGDYIDLINIPGSPDPEVAAEWHSLGKRVFAYGNPQVGMEQPETYRLNYGLLLWQNDYDGAMDYAYQSGANSIWNDFDSAYYKDHVFAYPTVNGVIDTLAWEGWREAVTDVRYLTTLLDQIKIAKARGKDTANVEAWIAHIKSLPLSGLNLDDIRLEITDQILSLVEQERVITKGASGISVDQATLNGSFISSVNTGRTTVSFEYGLNTTYGNTVLAVPQSLNGSGDFIASVSGLTPNTLYHYRAKAVNTGIVNGNDQVFTTLETNWWTRFCIWLCQKINR